MTPEEHALALLDEARRQGTYLDRQDLALITVRIRIAMVEAREEAARSAVVIQ